MECPDCGAPTVRFAVPSDLQEHAPDEADAAAICADCLRVHRATAPDGSPDFGAVSDAFPSSPSAAVPMALFLGLLPSLALNRSAVTELVGRVEAAGTDPLLVCDRLAADPALSPAVALERRRHQLEQLL